MKTWLRILSDVLIIQTNGKIMATPSVTRTACPTTVVATRLVRVRIVNWRSVRRIGTSVHAIVTIFS